jgi:hypothetical protein
MIGVGPIGLRPPRSGSASLPMSPIQSTRRPLVSSSGRLPSAKAEGPEDPAAGEPRRMEVHPSPATQARGSPTACHPRKNQRTYVFRHSCLGSLIAPIPSPGAGPQWHCDTSPVFGMKGQSYRWPSMKGLAAGPRHPAASFRPRQRGRRGVLHLGCTPVFVESGAPPSHVLHEPSR